MSGGRWRPAACAAALWLAALVVAPAWAADAGATAAATRSERPGSAPRAVTAVVPAGNPPAAVPAEQHSAADWAATIDRIASSVVAIQFDQTRAFDTEANVTAQATGFVVDAQRGLILTNRHVVTPGPVTAQATFLDREEVQLYPVYRDPVHDFGLYRYDPSKLHFIRPKALPLVPQDATIGREIRVIGNNAGEQLSILAGTIARLDREAPEYGVGRYNDFNTFYIQAASGTSGGSSGSPVIDIAGNVVALNAGGATGAASSFYLPLGRVRRALDLIQQGKPVTRGTLQTQLRYRPFDELRRLGLQAATETEVRRAQPGDTGMLVVDNVQPGSPSDGVLQPGDVLVRVDGRLVTRFEPLETVLDDNVGGMVELQLQRGGHSFSARLPIGDLTSITPSAYLEIGDAVVHTLSYQMARAFHRPIRGVFVASPGYIFDAAGVPRGALITQFDSRPVNTLQDFAAAVAGLGDGAQASVRYTTLNDPNGSQLASIRIDRRWYPARECSRNDTTGYWDCTALATPAPAPAPQPATVQYPHQDNRYAAQLQPSLVFINFNMPYSVSGVTELNYHGVGVIVDAKRGLIITDRNTVPVSMGDVRLTFAGVLQIPGKVIYVHPLHNLAVIQYDPRLLGATPVRAVALDTAPLKVGENVRVVGMDDAGVMRVRDTSIAGVDPLLLPLSRSVQFRDSNIEVASLLNPPDDFVGVLADKAGRVRGLWASFASDNGRELVQQLRGISSDLMAETLATVRDGPPLQSLEAEFTPQPLSSARLLGLTDEWIHRIQRSDPSAYQLLSVARLVGGSAAARVLQPGDILLAVDGRPVTQFREVERAVAGKQRVRVTVWRPDGEHAFEVQTATLSGTDVGRVVKWAGATLQAPYRAISAQRGIAPTGVYVSFFAYGSPASQYGLLPGRRIVQADGQPTPDLDAFLRVVLGRPDRASVRLMTVAWNGSQDVITLQLDRHYWPAYELVRGPDGWERRALE